MTISTEVSKIITFSYLKSIIKKRKMKEIKSLEILFLIDYLKHVIGSRIEKIKEISKNCFSLKLYKKDLKKKYLIISDKFIFLTDKNLKGKKLSKLGQILRSKLTNQFIEDLRQHEFERIVEIETKNFLLILELFDKGNLILLKKPERKVLIATRMRKWKDRKIKIREVYEYPPCRINPFKLSSKDLKELSGKKEIVKLLATDLGFGGEIAEKICEKLNIDKNEKKIPVLKLKKFFDRIKEEFEELKNINEKLEEEFESSLKRKEEKEELERIRKQQEEALRKWEEKEKIYRKIGKILYEKYLEVEEQLKEGKKKIKIDDLIIELDPSKSVQENAAVYFEKAKKAKKKIEGIKRAMEEVKEKLRERKREKIEEKLEEKPKEWYGKFRWFISSDGFLVVAGKDAKTNEKLIRRYMKDRDLVFHADITGSPFVLIKNPEGKEIPEQTIKEAAEFCASYSKAWKVGLAAIDVYYVKPEQVRKEGGLPTGSFMIYGKRNWVRRVPLRIAIGVKNGEIVVGPETIVKRKTKSYVIITPGELSVKEIIKKIQEGLKTKVELEKISKFIPYGKGSVVT